MKKIFTAVLCAMCAFPALNNVNAQPKASLEEEEILGQVRIAGENAASLAQQYKLNHQPRHEEIQAYAVSVQKDTVWGELKSVYKDGISIAPTVGTTFFTGYGAPKMMSNIQPVIGVSFCHDGIFGWQESDGTAVHPFAYELNISALLRQYEKSSVKSGTLYFSYKTTLYVKYRLFEDKWQKHRLNLVGTAGYLFSRDEAQIIREEKTDDYTFTAIFSPYYTGSGLTYGGGLEYRYQFPLIIKDNGKTNAAAGDGLTLKLMCEGLPVVEYNKHYHVPAITLSVAYTFGLARWIVR